MTWYNSNVYQHVSLATRTSSGAATAGLPVGHLIDGQLIVKVTGIGSTGARITPYWQSSADGLSWGDLVRGATMTATGVRIISMVGGIGQWARARWTQSATGLKFSMVFALKASGEHLMHPRSHVGCWHCLSAFAHRLLCELTGFDRSIDDGSLYGGCYWWPDHPETTED